LGDSPKVKAKSNEVVTSIQALLGEFGAGVTAADQGPAQIPAPEIKVEEAPLIELPTVEQVTEEHAPPVIDEHLEESEVVVEEESSALHEESEVPVVDEEPPSDEESDEGGEDEDEDSEDEDDDE